MTAGWPFYAYFDKDVETGIKWRIRPRYGLIPKIVDIRAQYAVAWNSLQRNYAPMYAKTGFCAWHYANSSTDYDIILLDDRNGMLQPALPEDVTLYLQPGGYLNFYLSDDAQVHGLRVEWASWHYGDAELHADLARLIYNDHSLVDYPRLPACVVIVVLVVLPYFVGPLDKKQKNAQLCGQRLRGTEQESVVGFNRRMKRRKKISGPLLDGAIARCGAELVVAPAQSRNQPQPPAVRLANLRE